MNTIKSVYYGWATLIVAGGGAYFFAKRSINADRAHKAELDRIKRQRTWELESQLQQQQQQQSSPSASQRTATTPLNPTATTAPSGVVKELERAREEREPGSEEQARREKSKYEASEAYRSRRGDRFS